MDSLPLRPPGKAFAWTDIPSITFKLEYLILKKLMSPQAGSSMEQTRQETPRPVVPPVMTDIYDIGGRVEQLLAQSYDRLIFQSHLTRWHVVSEPSHEMAFRPSSISEKTQAHN